MFNKSYTFVMLLILTWVLITETCLNCLSFLSLRFKDRKSPIFPLQNKFIQSRLCPILSQTSYLILRNHNCKCYSSIGTHPVTPVSMFGIFIRLPVPWIRTDSWATPDGQAIISTKNKKMNFILARVGGTNCVGGGEETPLFNTVDVHTH